MPSEDWIQFCTKGRCSQRNQIASVERCEGKDGVVRGYYSDIKLDPNLKDTDPMYPPHDHTTYPKDDSRMVIDARVINDMKSIVVEGEFWTVIEHLYSVGIEKGKIQARQAIRHDTWRPKRDFA